MRPSHSLLLVPLLSLAACGGPSGKEDAGVPDAGPPVVDSGVPDAGTPDGGAPDGGPDGGPGAQVCDAGTAPSGLPQLTGSFTVTDAGAVGFTANGDTLVGTWGAVRSDMYLPPGSFSTYVDPAGSYVDGGTGWIALRADGGYAQALHVNLHLKLCFGGTCSGGASITTEMPFDAESYGAAQVGPGGALTLTPACGQAPKAAAFANPNPDGGNPQLLLRVALDAGAGAPEQNADIVMDLVPLQQ